VRVPLAGRTQDESAMELRSVAERRRIDWTADELQLHGACPAQGPVAAWAGVMTCGICESC